MDYTPKPINTEGIQIPKELKALGELLAKNTHDIWSER